jgi:hypothetical protein
MDKKLAALVICLAGCLAASLASGGDLTEWIKQKPVPPDPSKVVVPKGYKVGIFKAGLSTPSAAAVDGDGNLWVAISGNLFGGPDADLMPNRTLRSTTRTET